MRALLFILINHFLPPKSSPKTPVACDPSSLLRNHRSKTCSSSRYSTNPICVSPEARFGRGGSGLFRRLRLRLKVARNTTQQ
ncbi:hypothetical protein ACB092_M011900 [Castanea dentata]